MTAEPAIGRPESDTGHLVNWTLIETLAVKPHKHLNIAEGEQYGVLVDGVFNHCSNGVNEVMEEARTVQHLCDLAGVPEGWNYSAHIDARVFLLMTSLFTARERLDRIAGWHKRESEPGGMVGDYCVECGHVWPCDTQRMAEGSYVDTEDDVP